MNRCCCKVGHQLVAVDLGRTRQNLQPTQSCTSASLVWRLLIISLEVAYEIPWRVFILSHSTGGKISFAKKRGIGKHSIYISGIKGRTHRGYILLIP